MLLADAHLGDRVELLAAVALDQVEVRPDLPVNFFPGDAVGFANEGYEFFQIPVSIDDVLRPHLAVAVDKVGALTASEHLALLLSKELIAVGALVQVILLFFK